MLRVDELEKGSVQAPQERDILSRGRLVTVKDECGGDRDIREDVGVFLCADQVESLAQLLKTNKSSRPGKYRLGSSRDEIVKLRDNAWEAKLVTGLLNRKC